MHVSLPLSSSRVHDAAAKQDSRQRKFGRFAWLLLAFNLIIIAVGTVVRATGSGDGCGSHWPLCNGETIPVAPAAKTVIEFTHRVVSGIDGPLVLALVAGAFLLFPKRHPVRPAAIATLALTLVEALVGAYLVKKRLVADNASVARAIWISLHLISTFFLLVVLSLTAWYAGIRESAGQGKFLKLRGQGAVGLTLGFAFTSLIALGISGAVTALGDTLFPVRDHADALYQAQYGAHFLQQLRLLHPYIAGSVGLYLLLVTGLVMHLRPCRTTRLGGLAMGYLFLAQVVIGYVNVLLRAPVWMQVVHLVMADLTWISLLLLAFGALSVSTPRVELLDMRSGVLSVPDVTMERPRFKDYVILTKPRVISLLLLTTITAAFIAAGGWPSWITLLSVTVGGYLSAGAANAINMVIDRDIDHRMKRTATRPTVTQKIPAANALYFGLGIAALAFAILWAGANLLTAMLALAGLVFYVVVYTLLLKRRTWHNIVIGGAAGAFPPLVGWAAVTGDLKSGLAWYLFAIVFLWTPAHFWALALLIKDDYKDAGVPMLPVVLGDKITVVQIALYTVATAFISLAPLLQGFVGWGYIAFAVLLNVVFLVLVAQLYLRGERQEDKRTFTYSRREASRVFHYSMLYLALLFVAMAVDRAIRM